MKRLFFLLLGLPVLLFSFQNQNLKALVETGYNSEISSSIIDSSHLDLFRFRLKYTDELSDYFSLFIQGEYATFHETNLFPYIATDNGSFHLKDALFKLKYRGFSCNIGRFIPKFDYFLSKSILELPSIHYPVVNENFLNDRIDGVEFDYKISLPYNKVLVSLSVGHKYYYYLYRMASLTDDIGRFAKMGIFAGLNDTLTADTLLRQSFGNYLYGGYLNLNFGPISVTGELGKKITNNSPDQLYYLINGRGEFMRVWLNLLLDKYDTEREISASVDLWIVENRFDINTRYEINLNNRENKFYILFKGII